jgi:hypothetical protein
VARNSRADDPSTGENSRADDPSTGEKLAPGADCDTHSYGDP